MSDILIIIAVYSLCVLAMCYANHKMVKAKTPRMSPPPIPNPIHTPMYSKDYHSDGTPKWDWRG